MVLPSGKIKVQLCLQAGLAVPQILHVPKLLGLVLASLPFHFESCSSRVSVSSMDSLYNR